MGTPLLPCDGKPPTRRARHSQSLPRGVSHGPVRLGLAKGKSYMYAKPRCVGCRWASTPQTQRIRQKHSAPTNLETTCVGRSHSSLVVPQTGSLCLVKMRWLAFAFVHGKPKVCGVNRFSHGQQRAIPPSIPSNTPRLPTQGNPHQSTSMFRKTKQMATRVTTYTTHTHQVFSKSQLHKMMGPCMHPSHI